jgi:hypothetical protein
MSAKNSFIDRQNRSMPVVSQERDLLAVAKRHNWQFRVMGTAPAPTKPVFYKDWWLIPVTDDNSHIPARALERVQAIYEAGIRPKAFVIAHEARPLLVAPAGAPQMSRLEFWSKQMVDHSAAAAKVAGQVLVVVTPVLLAILGIGFMAALGLAAAILTDPCLIAVTDNDVWIQVDAWMA